MFVLTFLWHLLEHIYMWEKKNTFGEENRINEKGLIVKKLGITLHDKFVLSASAFTYMIQFYEGYNLYWIVSFKSLYCYVIKVVRSINQTIKCITNCSKGRHD